MKWAQNLVLLGFSILCVWKADLYEPWMAERLVSTVTTIAVIVSLFGWGKCVSTSSRWDLLWMLGLGLMGTASYILVLLTEVRFLPIVLIIGWAQAYRNRYSYDFPKLTRTHWLFSSLVFILISWNASLLVIDTDALYYHISLPKHMWLENTLLSGETHPNGSRPLIWHLVLTLVYGISNIQTVVFFASIHALGAWISMVEYLEERNPNSGWVIWAIVCTSYTILEQLTVVSSNMVVLWWCWLAFRNRNKTDHSSIGFLIGFAIAGKYTAIVVAGLVGLTSTVRLKWKEALIATLIIGVWSLRNIIEGQPPLFPYAGWDMELPFLFAEKYGMGRDWWAMLIAPWNIIVHAKIQSVQFMGRLSAVLLLCSLSVVWFYKDGITHWKVWLILIGSWTFWCWGPHWIRHVFPFLGILLVLGLERFPIQSWFGRISVGILSISSISSNTTPFIEQLVDRWSENVSVPGDAAVEWINTQAPDGSVALLFLWQGANIDRPYILSSVEDHTPLRHWVLKYGKDSIQQMKLHGVNVIAVGPHTFHRHAFPFVSDESFESQWVEPVQILEQLLLEEARLITRQDGVDLYLLREND